MKLERYIFEFYLQNLVHGLVAVSYLCEDLLWSLIDV